MKVQYGDHVIEANDATKMLQEMKKTSPFEQEKSMSQYALDLAQRAKMSTGKKVRIRPIEALINDLAAAGVLKVLP